MFERNIWLLAIFCVKRDRFRSRCAFVVIRHAMTTRLCHEGAQINSNEIDPIASLPTLSSEEPKTFQLG